MIADLDFEENPTVAAIYEWHKKRGDSEARRGYLGASIIGHECDRFLWYSFRQCFKPQFCGRMYRLFLTGHKAEERFVEELTGIGCEVHATGDDQVAVQAFGGHFRGHADGVALGVPEAPKTWHLLEFKTHNAKSFASLCKSGVKKSKPTHYDQMMVYMGLMNLERALYLAENKDNSEVYSERIEFSKKAFDAIMHKAESIIFAVTPPERCSSRADDRRCKMCDAWQICWGLGNTKVPLPELSCRHCCRATPERNGEWSCAIGHSPMKPCDGHLLLPGLIAHAKPIDSDEHKIIFEQEDGTTWIHGVGGLSSLELIGEPAE